MEEEENEKGREAGKGKKSRKRGAVRRRAGRK